MLTINQAKDDKITYQFTVGALNGNTIALVGVTSPDVTITGVSNTTEQFFFTAETPAEGRFKVDTDITLSNGDKYNRCINFTVGGLCF